MGNLRFRLQTMFTALMLAFAITASAQTNIRYVKMTTAGGDNTKSGTSWETAKAEIQDAINDLVNNNLTGEVWVQGSDDPDHPAVYYPTETTESSNSQYYKSFKIPAGITVRGGFAGTEATAADRVTVDDKNFGKGNDGTGTAKDGKLDNEDAKSGVYKFKTILCGDLTGKKASHSWNDTKKQFDFTFYGNSYHVVWFAMNGFSSTGRANPLAKPAKLEGCIVEGGHAYTREALKPNVHEGYGGGIYMVANSFVYNCEVRNCDASRNGGGIYMDGGGIVRRTYVHDCQTLGIGTEFGFGGGICENGGVLNNSKTNPVVVAQSVVTNCVGRMGGGMALIADEIEGNNKYSVVANSTLVNNNTATVEAGGVYTYKGGGLASMTIARNKCYGSGITQNGQITGRSGGVYSRDASYIGNCVIWGNECEANRNIQYADSRSSLQDSEKTKFYYNALSNAEIADWSKSEKMGVLSLDDKNAETDLAKKSKKGYPLFENPTTLAGYLAEATTDNTINWKVFSESALHHAGINTADLDYEGLTPVPTGQSWDMQFGEFNSRCTMGAIISEEPQIAANIETAGEAHFFVDPNYNFAQHHDGTAKGMSWTTPTRFLGNVLEYINADREKTSDREFDNKKIFIHVKEGNVDNTDSYKSGRVRCTSLDIPSNVTIIGSYNSHLTGTDLSLRNIVHTPTVISAQLMNKYDYNIAHLINIDNKHDILIEGVKLSFANASSTELGNTNKDGSAITVVNSTDIKFRNIIVSNCTADHGSAVYADNSTVEFENCIFHNNETKTIANSGIVYGVNGSVLDFNHCDVLRNVGHASYLGGTTTNHWQNSIFYGNMDRKLSDTNSDMGGGITYSLPAFSGNTTQATGHHSMFDKNSASFSTQFGGGTIENGGDTGNKWQYNLQYAFVDGTGQGYPRFINPTKNSGVTEDGDQTYYGRGTSFEPHNNNPIVNMAAHADIHTSWGTDLVYVTRDFGGLPDIGAVENHEANQFEEGENAYTDGQKAYGEAYYVRDYSNNGSGLHAYMTSDGSTKGDAPDAKGIYNAAGELLDGSSWEYAVNGNGMYDFGGSPAKTYNTVFKTIVTTTPGTFKGTFTIKSGNYYIYLDGSTPKLTNKEANATHFEVEGVTTETMATGKKYIKGNNLYLYATSNGASTSTSNKNKIEIGGDATNGFTFKANSRYYRANNGSLTVTSYSSYASKWTFTPDKNQSVTTATEKAYRQDGTTEVTTKTTDVANNAEVTDHLKFHVYKNLDDYNNSTTKKTYKIKRQASTHYLKNTDNYLYPDNAKANGNDFILLQDGDYGKYYIYDVTSQKYLYYFTGTSGTSHVRAGSESDKTTWWINEPETGVLNFVFGAQPKGTDGNYAITVTEEGNVAATVDAQGSVNAKFVLVANAEYNVYNYEEGGSAPETINGLQYAVNTANAKYDTDNKVRTVSVGKGIYTNKTAANANSVSQPYAYMMKEGVNVYGGFPENGNPGMNERQPKTFETILQPQTASPYVTLQYGSHNGTKGNLGYNPDIMTVPTGKWGSCISSNNANDKASVGRVLVQPADFNAPTSWDGFTLRYGYLNTSYMYAMGDALTRTDGQAGGLKPDDVKVAGGAGALLQGNGILSNCVVFENVINCVPSRTANNTTKVKAAGYVDATGNKLDTYNIAGAGVLMTGASSTAIIENCEIGKNQALMKAVHTATVVSYSPDHLWIYGAGLYQNGGNVYNTILHDNFAGTIQGTTVNNMNTSANGNNEMILGAGAFVAKGNFYNNTVVNNFSCSFFHCHNNHCTFAGVHVFDKARIYNTLIADNESYWGYKTWSTSSTSPGNGVPVSAFKDNEAVRTSRDPNKVYVFYSFINVEKGKYDGTATAKEWVDLTSGTTSGNGATNIYIDSNSSANWDNTTYTDPLAINYRKYYTKGVYNMTGDDQYKLLLSSPCFNSGTEDIKDASGIDVTIPDYDAEYTDRVKDCAIDIGAYEFNGSEAVEPATTTVAGASDNQAIFYVTHNGFGDRSAKDPANAACAAKLQTVLDAAGRYKYLNPTKQVIVKVASDWDMAHAAEPEDFTYYATRTTDQTDQDVRVWSIMVPRGVEVWGGYTDVPMKMENNKVVKDNDKTWSNTNNGFYSGSTDLRDITGNPTYFDSYYENKLEHTGATTYHVVTFTDRIFDQNGLAYTKDDFKGKSATVIKAILKDGKPSTFVELPGNNEDLFAHMSEAITDVSTGISGNAFQLGTTGNYASNRAVIDGIFVSGGQADASSNSNNSTVNINSYGGAALVNDFAYVRNCILTGNSATNGGALALTGKALVSGCLIMENEASNAGGGIYVFENGTKLSNGTTINTTAGTGEQMDINMPHVFTSTIVNNKAQQGGGIWFTEDVNANARFNSVAVWQNSAQDQDNVFGMVNPEQPTDDETLSEIFYPFSFSLIQNVRASGTNNLEALPLNRQGMRFVNMNHDVNKGTDKDQTNIAEEKEGDNKFADFGYYGLTTYSMLCSNGMPKSYYEELKRTFAIADNDFMGTNRIDNINSFVEIGARALPKRMPNKQLMLRLFVAHPDAVDTETATRFMRLTGSAQSKEEYYSQMGSSFAYPFNFLQDAIDYITRARNGQIADLKLMDGTAATSDIVRNLPFEIVLGSGIYYPRQSLNGGTESVWAHTFAIPEGVTIIGGFNPQGGGETYYGRYYKKGTIGTGDTGDIYTYVTPIPDASVAPGGNEVGRGNKFGSETVTLPAVSGDAEHANQVAKTITFQQWHIQDIADRRAMADNNKNGIIEPWEFANQTIISGNAVNGETDGVYHIMTAVADADAVGLMPKAKETNSKFTTNTIDTETGYQWKEMGQQIRLNGLIVTGGNALTYLSTALDDYGSYMFYHGAGLLVDGNRYKTNVGGTNKPEFHNSAAYGLGYRDIPVSVTNCQFRNNIAGYGGAISSNGSLSLFASAFEQNMALGQTEKPKTGETWTTNISGTPQNVTEVSYPGHGGAIHVTNQLSAFNTLFANNEACLAEGETPIIELVKHPTFRVPVKDNASATLRAAGGAIMMGSAANHHIVNCDFVRNKANAYPAVFTMNPTTKQKDAVDTHDYSQIINTVAWGNEVNIVDPSNEYYKTASKLMVNIGKKNRDQGYITSKSNRNFYDPSFKSGKVPSTSDLSVDNADATTSDSWQEAAWFCAYEDGVGFKPNNTNDLRDKIVYSAGTFAPTMIKEANVVEGVKTYQNCNMLIVAENGDVAGPNFGNPSVKAGFDGFMEGADWSPARFNRLTDNGNGWIKQTVETTTDDIKVTFNNDETLGTGYQGAYPYTHYISDIVTGKFPEYKLWLAIGNEKYMEATNDPETRDLTINGTPIHRNQKNYPRISPDPTMGVTKAYIDIGVYEYQKQPLLKPGSEVDILWVSTQEKPENGPANGLTWKTPTSDLQRAIETLLQSRNGHKKEIRIMEGEYAPVTPQKVGETKYNAFVIDTKSLNDKAITPSTFEDGTNNDQYYAQSITIKGGYSEDIMYEYDPVQYKTIIRQNEVADGVNTDYLIYVADPTVRYAGTTGTSHDGAIGSTDGAKEASKVKTMPIQVDGVTLINDKATAETKGSAIYYPDYEGSTAPESGVTGAHSVSVGGKVVYYKDETEFKKVDSDGKHIGQTVDYETEFAEITTEGSTTVSDTKILITKTQVIGNGNKTGDDPTKASAVYIGKNGGAALIYNTVFHSNYGMPLDAWNTINVNNTFGMNGGLVKLNNTDAAVTYPVSQIHNSALWMNNSGNAQFSMPGVSVATTEGDTKGDISGDGKANFTYNSFTGGNLKYADYNAVSGHVAGNLFNTGLAENNADIANGPNFDDPTNADIEARNFDIKPSVRLLNKGNDESIESGSGKYFTLVVNNKYDFSLASTTDKDAIYRDRLKASHIDIGAYEFQGNLQQVLYVDPNKSHSDDATGENWSKAFGYGDLQDAMDLAGIYHMNNPEKESYVFVKGASSTNKTLHTNETLTIRDGVTVYGSIMSSYNDWHEIKDEHGVSKYTKIEDFIKDMTNQREGVASDAASKTIVNGIKTSEYTSFDGTTNDTPALVDGIVVTDPGQPTAPVVDVTNKSENAVIVLRNILVADNDLTTAPAATNVAQISNGLIYEALFRDNQTTGAALKVSNYKEEEVVKTRGYAVNVTVEGVTKGADNSQPVDGGADYAAEKSAQIFNSITNSIDKATVGSGTAGAYRNIVNKGISGYFYNIYDPNLNYQLTETSKYIDMCENDNPLSGITEAANLVQFINYTTDRDLLGNPRLLTGVTDAGKIDRGAFETWKVKNALDGFTCGEEGTIASAAYNATYDDDAHALIKKHFYPHDGSVCYVMENQSLVIDAFDPEHEVKPTPENPGFLLIKEGANFYGNGRPATCAFLAVERKVRKGGSIVAVPYAMKYETKADVAQVSTDSNNDLVLNTAYSNRAYKYSGNERMDWKYIFQTTQTNCWDETSEAKASQGVLFEPNGQYFESGDDNNTEKLFRFTAQGASLTDYIYTEELADPVTNKKVISKSVTLTKYDDAESTNHGADYTDEKDMGWNCIGLPWLVSNYETYGTSTTAAHGVDNKKMMNIPHEMWLYYNGTSAPDGNNVNGDGGYYSVNSWENTASAWHVASDAAKSIWVGEGIFVQTATLNDTEDLKFYRPVAPAVFNAPASTPAKRYYFAGVYETNTPEAPAADDAVLVATEFYTADGVHLNTTGSDLKSLPQMPKGTIILMRQHYSNGKTRTQKFTY